LPEVATGTLLRWRIKGLSGVDVCIFSGLICIFLFVGDGDDFGTYFGVVGGIGRIEVLLLLLVAGARDLEELAVGVLGDGDGGSSRSVLQSPVGGFLGAGLAVLAAGPSAYGRRLLGRRWRIASGRRLLGRWWRIGCRSSLCCGDGRCAWEAIYSASSPSSKSSSAVSTLWTSSLVQIAGIALAPTDCGGRDRGKSRPWNLEGRL